MPLLAANRQWRAAGVLASQRGHEDNSGESRDEAIGAHMLLLGVAEAASERFGAEQQASKSCGVMHQSSDCGGWPQGVCARSDWQRRGVPMAADDLVGNNAASVVANSNTEEERVGAAASSTVKELPESLAGWPSSTFKEIVDTER